MSLIRARQRSITAVSPHNANSRFLVPIRRGPQLLINAYPFNQSTPLNVEWVHGNTPSVSVDADGILSVSCTAATVAYISQQLTGLIPGATYRSMVYNPDAVQFARMRVGTAAGGTQFHNLQIAARTNKDCTWVAPANGIAWVSMVNAYGTVGPISYFKHASTRLAGGGGNVDFIASKPQLLQASFPFTVDTLNVAGPWVPGLGSIARTLVNNNQLKISNSIASFGRIDQTVPTVPGATYHVKFEMGKGGTHNPEVRVGAAAGGFELAQLLGAQRRFVEGTFVAPGTSVVVGVRITNNTPPNSSVFANLEMRQESIVVSAFPGPNLLTNSNPFTAATVTDAAWVASSSVKILSGVDTLRVENTAAVSGRVAYQFPTDVGGTYRVQSFRAASVGTGAGQVRAGLSSNGQDYFQASPAVGVGVDQNFVATATSAFLTLRNSAAVLGDSNDWQVTQVTRVA
jgi:hypothetical protein